MEVWKRIEDCNDYEISNHGNVKSFICSNTKILKPGKNNHGYLLVVLMNDEGDRKTKMIHKLVAEHFLNHIPSGFEAVINHKDFNKENNKHDNLEIVTQRENTNQKHLKPGKSSKYTGVSKIKKTNKWYSQILINGKVKSLGFFDNEYDAHIAYENKLRTINQ